MNKSGSIYIYEFVKTKPACHAKACDEINDY